jgi:WD40 repeat protein
LVAWLSKEGVQVWDLTGAKASAHLPVRVASGTGLSFFPDGTRVAVLGATGQGEVWDLTATRQASVFAAPAELLGGVAGRALSPDGRRFAAASPKSELQVWDPDGKKLWVPLPRDIRSDVCAVAWSPDGERLAVGIAHGGVMVWDLAAVWRKLAEIRLAW